MKTLYELRVEVSYAVVIAADTKDQALEHVKSWEHAWDSSADLIGVSQPEIVSEREPIRQDSLEDEAHEVV
jgi:hypothetical protein